MHICPCTFSHTRLHPCHAHVSAGIYTHLYISTHMSARRRTLSQQRRDHQPDIYVHVSAHAHAHIHTHVFLISIQNKHISYCILVLITNTHVFLISVQNKHISFCILVLMTNTHVFHISVQNKHFYMQEHTAKMDEINSLMEYWKLPRDTRHKTRQP